jgi:hypothetical protein
VLRMPPSVVPVHTIAFEYWLCGVPYSSSETATIGSIIKPVRLLNSVVPSIVTHGPCPTIRSTAFVDESDSHAFHVPPRLAAVAETLHRRSAPSRPVEPPPAVRRSPLYCDLVTNTREPPLHAATSVTIATPRRISTIINRPPARSRSRMAGCKDLS